MSAPVMAGGTAVNLGAAVSAIPIQLAQETPAQERHEQQRYDQQMRARSAPAPQPANREHHSKHHRWHHYLHKHHQQPMHSEAGTTNPNAGTTNPNNDNGRCKRIDPTHLVRLLLLTIVGAGACVMMLTGCFFASYTSDGGQRRKLRAPSETLLDDDHYSRRRPCGGRTHHDYDSWNSLTIAPRPSSNRRQVRTRRPDQQPRANVFRPSCSRPTRISSRFHFPCPGSQGVPQATWFVQGVHPSNQRVLYSAGALLPDARDAAVRGLRTLAQFFYYQRPAPRSFAIPVRIQTTALLFKALFRWRSAVAIARAVMDDDSIGIDTGVDEILISSRQSPWWSSSTTPR